MDNGLIGLIGLARKAGKAEVGEESVSIAAKAHKARLILLASDAGEHTRRHGERLGEQGNCPALPLPLTKAELGGALGRGSCAILAFTDVGMAAGLQGGKDPPPPAPDPAAGEGFQSRRTEALGSAIRRQRNVRRISLFSSCFKPFFDCLDPFDRTCARPKKEESLPFSAWHRRNRRWLIC